MSENLWQKIRRNHLLLTVLCCLVPMILVVGFLSLSKKGSNSWSWLIILLCPLAHIFITSEASKKVLRAKRAGSYDEKT